MERNLLFIAFILAFGSIKCKNANEIIQISREEFDTLKDTVSRLQNLAENQIKVNQQLQSELHSQRSVILDLQTTVSQQAEKIKQHADMMKVSKESSVTRQNETKKRNSGTNLITRKRNTESTVAFFATLTQASLDHLGLYQNIVFEDVVTNFGNAYNHHQGVFVAPVSGLYLITTSVLSRQNREFWAAVVVNGTEIVHLNGRGTDGRHGSGAQTMVIVLKKGDDVSVQNYHQTDDDYWGDKYTSFGGFLIQEFETEPTTIVG